MVLLPLRMGALQPEAAQQPTFNKGINVNNAPKIINSHCWVCTPLAIAGFAHPAL